MVAAGALLAGLGIMDLILAAIMSYYSSLIYKRFSYAAILFVPLYAVSGLIITRSVIMIVFSLTGSSNVIDIFTEVVLFVSFSVLVYMFYSLKDKMDSVFRPYSISVMVQGLPREVTAKVSVDYFQVVDIGPDQNKFLDLSAGVHTVSIPERVEFGDDVYVCNEPVRRVSQQFPNS